MTETRSSPGAYYAIMTALTALVFGFLGAALWSVSGLADTRTRAFLMDNPEMLPEMAEELRARETAKRLADAGDAVFEAFPGAVLGNPQGSRVLVEFTDYNCPYCEASLKDVVRLVADNPDLKVVVREWPIFEGSALASRMALAAARQGKYRAFHERMFALGPATPETVLQAAEQVGLDLERAKADAVSEAVTAELARNQALARQIGFTGTPAWVTGDRALDGAVGYEGLTEALEKAGPQAES
ncbi:MAG: DsbA family protein [Erythrobacter sp.]|uniref:DsbA family protein n=1 Tax=Erythrobacter sp. TaxID=1042 RepID=UPI002630F2AB|nr:DsbA family protein [Erythrobacter sp.]MDJ0978551.1 DsbA family protein [Erythrobacter sp.]